MRINYANSGSGPDFEPTVDNLKNYARKTTNDTAAQYFFNYMYELKKNKNFNDEFKKLLRGIDRLVFRENLTSEFKILFVPGLFYKRNPETKGDMKEHRELFRSKGFDVQLVEIREAGTVEENAAIIADVIRTIGNKKIILVSASKGGPETAYAIGKILGEEETSKIKAWISIGGALKGSPLTEHVTGLNKIIIRAYGWFCGFSFDNTLKSLSTRQRREAWQQLKIPGNIFMVHYVAVPFSHQVTKEVRDPYRTLEIYGPNDGIVLLGDYFDVAGENSIILLAPGYDHRFIDPEIKMKSLVMAYMVFQRIEKGGL